MITLLKKTIDSDDIGKPALFPVYNSDYDKLQKVPFMKHILMQSKKVRNVHKHNLVFSLVRMIKSYLEYDHPYKELDERSILYLIERENGLCKVVRDRHGETVSIPLSISFAKMTEDQHDLLLDAVFLACSVVTKIDINDLRENYQKYLGDYR